MKPSLFPRPRLRRCRKKCGAIRQSSSMERISCARAGIFGQFKGLPEEFGDRIRDVPISETMIVGAALGAALTGTRPVADMHFADFIGVAFDEVANQIAKNRYMFGGQANIPSRHTRAGRHQQASRRPAQPSVEGWLQNIPGLIIVSPSSPAPRKVFSNRRSARTIQ